MNVKKNLVGFIVLLLVFATGVLAGIKYCENKPKNPTIDSFEKSRKDILDRAKKQHNDLKQRGRTILNLNERIEQLNDERESILDELHRELEETTSKGTQRKRQEN